MAESSSVTIIIVTHNADAYFAACLDSLYGQSLAPRQVLVVDSGSRSVDYLEKLGNAYPFITVQEDNIGFSRANNAGLSCCDMESDFFIFLNPDTVLPSKCLETACAELKSCPEAGCLTPRLLGYDLQGQAPSGRLDSTGIFRKAYGRWYDRGQGEVEHGQYSSREFVPAACGAFFFMRKEALQDVLLAPDTLFEPEFFLYKEDIELSLRLRRKGWRILYSPSVIAYHGRGWQADRKKMEYGLRMQAARNEMILYRKHPSPYFFWAMLKWLLVKYFRI
ncbi:glycosyltransferase family 2 protein [Desulfogranum japonicum]|uniref:glycosyltransferase family 2 protein n=1 Tax=Desulfogranum japonicum TaxID=231447 RepID=UPI0004169B6E|nr:glycosyltransferase family 2 protein [Desulfogranum japonicum]